MNKHRRIAIVVGKTGYGKSYLIKSVINLPNRLVVFDLQGEYQVDNAEIFTDFDSFRHFVKMNHDNTFLKAVCRFDNFDDYEAAFQVCYIVGNLFVVIEEVSNFSSSGYLSPTLEKLVRFGRHRSISLVGVSQRFADIGLLLRNNLDMLVVFNLTAPNDIKYLEQLEYVGERANEIPRLQKRQHLIFCNV